MEAGRGGRREEWRAGLRQKLPQYMLPTEWVELKKIPLTPTGKVDRKALPQPLRPETSEQETQGRQNAVEEIIGGIFAEVLKVHRVGRDENFFSAGGHSLLATQVMLRLRRAFGMDLPLRTLFEAPTVIELARRVRDGRGGSATDKAYIPRAQRETKLPLSYAQERLWFLDQLEPGNAAYNMPFGLHLLGELKEDALRRSLQEIVARHEVLRTTFPSVDGHPEQAITAELKLRLDVVDLTSFQDSQRDAAAKQIAEAEAAAKFDLGKGALLRAKLVRLAEQDHILLVTMHHIVSDGWSGRVMMREFSKLYGAYVAGEEPTLPQLQIQYADYAVWQRKRLEAAVLEEQIGYWRQQLAQLEPLRLPEDHSRLRIDSKEAAILHLGLPAEVSDALCALSRKQNVTLFMLLTAVFQLLLSRYSGQDDVAVGTPVAGRHWLETEDLIGCFVNTLVLRTKLSGNPKFAELLSRVRTVALNGYQYEHLPFEKLVEELQPERDLSSTPLFGVMLVFESARHNKMELPGLTLSEFKINSPVPKFDLLLDVQNTTSIQAELTYRSSLFAESTMQTVACSF